MRHGSLGPLLEIMSYRLGAYPVTDASVLEHPMDNRDRRGSGEGEGSSSTRMRQDGKRFLCWSTAESYGMSSRTALQSKRRRPEEAGGDTCAEPVPSELPIPTAHQASI